MFKSDRPAENAENKKSGFAGAIHSDEHVAFPVSATQ